MAPRASPKLSTPRSPNYFALDHTNHDPFDSADPRHAKNKWTPQTATVHPIAASSPKSVAPDPANEGFAAFRKQSESANTFTLGHGNLSHFSLSSSNRSSMGATSERSPSSGSVLSPRSMVASPEKDEDRMEVDSAYYSHSQRPSQSSTAPSFFDLPRNDSPESFSASPQQRTRTSADDHHGRLSLPYNPPSPAARQRGQAAHRAATLPVSLDKDAPIMITPQNLVDSSSSSSEVLLLDLRVYPQYSQSRIAGALNLCIPTTLLKRPSFTLQKLADTFTKPDERAAFERWRQCQYIVVYDEKSSQVKDAVSCINTLKKFTNQGWKGNSYILRGGFLEFAKKFPDKIDIKPSGATASPSKNNLSIEPPVPGIAPVAGGCPMPATRTAANPFFGNIRQNMDLIGGVGQLPIKRPAGLTQRGETELPLWLRAAVDEQNEGKAVSEQFLNIERAEQCRMQEALSCSVSYGTPKGDVPTPVQLAGIEKGQKNRYNNIWPYAHARVKLQGKIDGTCDYINASHVKASRSNKQYIATQGPLPATFEDFWKVVWEQDVRVIVMLTAESEGGQLKCHPYWSGKDFGQMKLKPLSEKRISLEPSRTEAKPGERERPRLGSRRSTNPTDGSNIAPAAQLETPHVVMRKFTLSHAAHPFTPMREITQLQYSSWPDFGAPAHPSHVLSLVEHCNAVVKASTSPVLRSQGSEPPQPRPVLVHCSAGCGRTGTFCTVDSVIDMLQRQRAARLDRMAVASPMQIDRKTSGSFDGSMSPGGGDGDDDDDMDADEWLYRADDVDLVARTVEDFRHQRLSMVQSLRQFVLCYETVLEYLVGQQPAEWKGKDSSRRSYPSGI
ncbi:MAG: hypothetical protein M1817_002851 [Caeruleum heppii]|nr:MAG: hypothetical protein M1817_002851 [Caeruleum heppii]